MEQFRDKEMREGIVLTLRSLGLDLTDPNFKDTPDRMVRMYNEIFDGLKDTAAKTEKLLSCTFPSDYNGMIVSEGIRAYSTCGHHLVPIVLDVVIGYIPDGKILGLSKLARVADLFAKRPLIQEDYTEQLASAIMGTLKPLGVGVYVSGLHYCQTMRGAKQQDARMVTTSVYGCFRNDEKTRNEFLTEARKVRS